MTPKADPKSRRPGRPRSEAAKKAILQAAYELLKEKGIASISTPELARAAGVSTATLYRWWKTKEAIMLDAFFERMKPALPFESEGSPLERLRGQVVRGAGWLRSEDGRLALRLISDIQGHPKLQRLFLDRFFLPRRALYAQLIKEAIAAGELRRDTDAELLMDALHGPLYFRLLIGHAPLDQVFATQLATRILPAFTP